MSKKKKAQHRHPAREVRAKATGDCGDASFYTLLELHELGINAELCHGWPIGTGEFNLGKRYWHAWVEISTESLVVVVDLSNGHDLKVPRDWYYKVGQIEAEKVQRFDLDVAKELVLTHQHFGPWLKEPYKNAL